MGGDLDLLQKTHRQPERDRGRARLKVGQPKPLGLAPVEIGSRVLAFPIGSLFGPVGEDGGILRVFFISQPFARAHGARLVH